MPVAVPTARLDRTAAGTPYCAEFEDIYHSSHGGLAQARHVFLAGNDLPSRWRGRDKFVIVETGFGLGLNFLATWQAWREDAEHPRRLHFVSVERSPFAIDDLRRALEPFDELSDLAQALCLDFPPPLAGFHRLHFDRGRVILTLLIGEAETILPQLVARADAFFLDGFSPARNPGIWSPPVVRELARLASHGATLATWTVAGGVRSALGDAGFRVEKRVGFATKREMLAGRFEAREAEQAAPRTRRAVVVGGGLGGTLVAERLCARDWDVDLVDALDHLRSTSVGLVRPVANLRDAVNAQVSRGAFTYALQHFRALEDEAQLVWNRCGVLQLAEGKEEEARFAAIASSQGYPAGFLEFVDGDRAREIAARPVRGAGWWFRGGAAVSPASLIAASLARGGSRITRKYGRWTTRIEREGNDWRALDENDRVIAEAPVLIVANAADAARLFPEARLTLSNVRGQVTYLPPDPNRALGVIVSGNGYVAPMPGGGHCVGASYHHKDDDASVRLSDHRDNLARAESMLPGFTAGLDATRLDGWTGFRATVPDRLPIFGVSAVNGLSVATGLGSRGLLWAPLGAELLACQLEGEPLPLGRDLGGAVSPRRFLS